MFNVKVADVNHALFAGGNLNKCAEIHNSCNYALINSTNLRVVSYCLYHKERTLCIFNIKSTDEYAAVFFNVNLTFALFANLLYNLALFADNVADL